MKVFSAEKSKLLAEQNGWSLLHAQGFVDGETCRRLGNTPAKIAVIGIDEYSLGFRAGFFERQSQDNPRVVKRRDFDQPVDIASARAHGG